MIVQLFCWMEKGTNKVLKIGNREYYLSRAGALAGWVVGAYRVCRGRKWKNRMPRLMRIEINTNDAVPIKLGAVDTCRVCGQYVTHKNGGRHRDPKTGFRTLKMCRFCER